MELFIQRWIAVCVFAITGKVKETSNQLRLTEVVLEDWGSIAPISDFYVNRSQRSQSSKRNHSLGLSYELYINWSKLCFTYICLQGPNIGLNLTS